MLFQRTGYLVPVLLLLVLVGTVNAQVSITSLPASVSIHEDITVEQLQHTIVFTSGSDPVTCSLPSSVPSSAPFSVRLITSSTDYGVYSNGNPSFDSSSQSSYTLNVACTDGTNTDTQALTASITPNSAPVYSNLANSTNVSTTTAIGTTVFTVLTTDAEGDTLNYSMTCSPTPCPFIIFDSGAIVLNEDTTLLTTQTFVLSISVADPRNTVGPTLLTVTITDINTAVTLTNLPHASNLTVNENTALGTNIFNVTYNDPDTSQTITFTMASSPVEGLTYFSINQTSGEITTANNVLNYESLTHTSFVFNISVTDILTTTSETLFIDIQDVNETPSFGATAFSLTANEGTAGTVLGQPEFAVRDQDSGDTTQYSLDCGTSSAYFRIGNQRGVRYQSDYDVDTGSLSSTVECNVTVTDSGGLTDVAPLTITIENINDNTPQFVPASYSFSADYYATSSTALGTVTATDGDAGSFGTIIYTIDQSALSTAHFSIDSSGVISFVVSPVGISSTYNGATVTITAIATDTGGLTSNATVTVFFSQTTTTLSTTTTTRYLEFLDDPSNWAWLVPCCMVLAVAFIATVYMIYTCRGKHGCEKTMLELRRHWKRNKKPRRFVPKERKKPPAEKPVPMREFEKPPSGTDMEFWGTRWDH